RSLHGASGPAAAAAGAGHAEEALLEGHLARAAAGRARGGAGAGGRAVARAGGAGLRARDLDVRLRPEGRLFERQVQVVAQVGAAPGPAPPPPEQVAEAEEVAQDVAEVREDRGIEPARARHARVPVDVVTAALLGVAQDAVGLGRLLEPLLGLLVPRVAVGVVLHGQAAVGGLDLLLGGVAGDAKQLVV